MPTRTNFNNWVGYIVLILMCYGAGAAIPIALAGFDMATSWLLGVPRSYVLGVTPIVVYSVGFGSIMTWIFFRVISDDQEKRQ